MEAAVNSKERLGSRWGTKYGGCYQVAKTKKENKIFYTLKWFGHLERMPCNSIVYSAYTGRRGGNRARGRTMARFLKKIYKRLDKDNSLTMFGTARKTRTTTLYYP